MQPSRTEIYEISRLLQTALPAMTEPRAIAEADFVARNGIRVLVRGSERYPRRLESCADSPRVLYSLGACSLDAEHTVGIVGTRRATASGLEFTRRLVEDLAGCIDNLVVVSGLAYGIDVAAHRAALAAGVPTVAVVAHGLNMIYPADHRQTASRMIAQGGAIVTEYPSDTVVHRSNFLARNRIVAGLCDVLVVAESASHGGALVTARHAASYGRTVCAAPARWNEPSAQGCNALIAARKAELITSADDLIKVMGWKGRADAPVMPAFDFDGLAPEVRVIVDHLRANPRDTFDDMARALSLTARDLGARLMEMEMDDMVTSLPGGLYQLNV
ncbi:MAG: DNA-processing protein DprA [Bacteroidales bacterium]|nr:DNA-processing protein DprA [Bacteroidales bacterium]